VLPRTRPVTVAFHNVPFGREYPPIASGPLVASSPPAKICADGSPSTHIVLTGDAITTTSVGNLTLELVGDGVAPGDAALYLGSVTAPAYDADEEGAVVTFTHPRLVGLPEISRRIRLRVMLDGMQLGEYPIDVYRAPVLMVHGLWSYPSAFDEMTDVMVGSGRWSPLLAPRLNYRSTHAAHFAENVPLIRTGISTVLMNLVREGYSAGRVDVVGHSMGGILARLHLQSEGYAGSSARINRLITLNTPHAGSQGADLIMSALALQTLLAGVGRNPWEGAVDNLRVNSTAIDGSLNGSFRNRNVVPSHALYTLSDLRIGYSDWPILFLDYAALVYNLTSSEILDRLYEEPSDLVVAQSSQIGGLPVANTTLVLDQMHVGSPANSEVIAAVIDLLDTDPLATIYAQGGFDPPDLVYTTPPPPAPFGTLGELDVTITSPATGSVVAPGETISVVATGSGSADRFIFAAGSARIPLVSDTQSGTSSSSFAYTVPDEAVGLVSIAVMGLGAAGAFAIDTVSVIVEPTAALTGLSVYPEQVVVSAGNAVPFTLTGLYADGIERDLTGASGIGYAVTDPGVAGVNAEGEVVGIAEGETTLTVTYRSQTATTDVLVLPALPPVSAEPTPDNPSDEATIQLRAYPNPLRDRTTLRFILPESGPVRLSLYDVLGREVAVATNGWRAAGPHEAALDVSALPAGVYVARLAAGARTATQRLTVVR